MAGGPRLRRSTAESLDALLDLATQRLITHSLDAIASLVTPSVLARSTQTVSVDTAYRLLESPERTIQLLVDRIITPEFSSDSLDWPTFGQVYGDVIESYSAKGSIEGAHAALCVLIEKNFSLPSTVIGRLVAAATMTASESWDGEVHIRDARLQIARRIRDGSRRSLHVLDDEFTCLLQIALVELRRRPRPGFTVERVALMLRTFVDGAIDRMLLDPGSMTVDEVATAAIDLGFALTETGLLGAITDRFDLPVGFPLDDAVVAAERAWTSDGPDGVLDAVAEHTGLTDDELRAAFPDESALADAVLQCLVIGGPITGSRESRFALLSTALRRLAQCADAAPSLLAAASDRDEADSALAELRDAALHLATLRRSSQPEPDRLAQQLVASASKGMAYWDTARFLLDLLKD